MVLMVLTALIALLADLGTKQLAQTMLNGDRIVAVPGLLALQLRHNSGIALGMLQGNRWALLVLPVIMLIICWAMLRRYQPTGYMRFAVGLILGGFAGNYIERLLKGYVVDMLETKFIEFPVFNVADCFITCGCILLMIHLIFFNKAFWKEEKK